jgi:trigger factor
MQIDVREVEPCKLAIHYVADAGDIFNKRVEILKAFKKAPVPGFRPGKASDDAIRLHYRSQIEESLKRALAEDAFHNTLFEKKIKPHGAPRFNSLLLVDGKFTCEFDLHTKPSFDLADYENIEMPRPHETETITSVTEKMLQELRIRFGEVAPYTEQDFVQLGDNVIVDYEGFIDGEKIDKLCSVGEMLTVGSSNMTQFDDNILGMALGDVREFDMVVPEVGLPSIAGKTVHLKVNLTMGSKTVPSALDDDLAIKLGKKTMDELRIFVAGSAAVSIQNRYKAQINEALANRLVADNQVDVPIWMSLSEAQYLAHNSKLDWATLADPDKEQFLTMAERNVKLSLILDKIRDLNPEAQMTDQEVFEVIKTNLVKTKVTQSLDEVIQQMNKTGYLQILFSRIRDEYAMDFVTKKIRIIE